MLKKIKNGVGVSVIFKVWRGIGYLALVVSIFNVFFVNVRPGGISQVAYEVISGVATGIIFCWVCLALFVATFVKCPNCQTRWCSDRGSVDGISFFRAALGNGPCPKCGYRP